MTPSQAAKSKSNEGAVDLDLVKAMAHPLRYQLLLKLDGRVASPNELSKEVDASVGTVSYHIRLLEQMGFAELVDQKMRRGAVEHFYRATQRAWFSNEGWARLPVAVRRSMAGATLTSIWETINQSAAANTFGVEDMHVSSTPLTLDGEAFVEVCEVLDDAIQRVMDIQAQALARGSATRSTQLVLMHFDRG